MKKRIIILIGLIITILGAYISFSYALFEKTETQSGNNTISTYNCLDLSIEGEENINITSAFPIQDEEGLLQTPYKFKVKNKCDHYVETEIGIELQSNNTLGDEYLRFKMNEISEYEDGSIYLLSEKRRYNEVEGESVLDSKYPIIIDELNGNEEKEYELRVWIPYTAGNEVMNKNFKGKVYVSGIVKTDPKYYVNTIEDLVTLSNEVNSGNSYEGVTVVLTKDLDFNNDNSYENANRTDFGDLNEDGTVEGIKIELTKTSGKGFTPIGITDNYLSDIYFKGNFDGQNHRIDNLYINNSNINGRYIGLFGRISDSKISNLTLSGEVKTSVLAFTAGIIGAVAGNSNLYNLVNEIDVTGTVTQNNLNNSIGGIVGATAGDSNVNLRNLINKGKISGGTQLGGLIAINQGSLTIENSHNEGKITNNIGTYAGGLLGRDNATSNTTKIYNSYNSGNVSLTTNDSANRTFGGLVGVINGTLDVRNSYNSGNVSYDYDYANNTLTTAYRVIVVGGIVGAIRNGVIENSYNNGTVGKGNWNGGIFGGRYGNGTVIINKSYNAGEVVGGYTNNNAAATISGITGYNNSSNLFIINSYNNGQLNSPTDKKFTIAGLVGVCNNSSSTIINSYNSANATAYNEIAAGIYGYYASSSYPLVLNNVFNSGTIYSTKGAQFGLVGGTYTLKVTNSYYLSGVNSTGGGDYGTSLTSTEIAGREFVSTLNKNVNNINLSEISSDLAGYKLSSWIYDPTAGHPVLDNSN